MAWWFALAAAAVAGATQDSPREIEIIKQINRVNEDGSYTFGYEAADGSFKIETRDVQGNVKGMFGFIDEAGELKKVSYTANNGTGFKASGASGNERPLPLSGYTTETTGGEESTRRPVLVLRQPSDPTRQPVIQHIPRRSLSNVASATTTTPTYGEYVKGRRINIALPNRNTEEATTPTPQVTEEPEADEPTQIPLRKLLVTKRPLSKGGNNLRRQLGNEPESPSGDIADVYSGGAGIPRYIPVQSVRSPQSSLLANLPPHVATAIRQQQIARAAAALRSYPPGIDAYPTPVPIPAPRPGVIDQQEFPPVRSGRNNLPPVRALYRPGNDDGPTQIPFPMASLRSLRDELMDYIMQYLNYRLNGGNPYLVNSFQPPFQTQNYPYQSPINYQGGNPNFYNPYLYQPPPYSRGPYQPPYGPLDYPPLGYPLSSYPGQNFPQPLPFSSPNKQQAAQQYRPIERSTPNYQQFTPSQRLSLQGYDSQSINPVTFEAQRNNPPRYDSQRNNYEAQSQRAASTYEQAESRGTADQSMYSLPPADVLRMMLARGLSGGQTTTTSAPVRNVQILGSSSSLSTTTVRPPAPVDEMEMQA